MKKHRMFQASNPPPLIEGDIGGEQWPTLPYAAWNATLGTLHMWTQIVGKVKPKLSPFLNEWWNVGFSISAQGMITSTFPFHDGVLQIDFDFLDHRLNILVNDGRSRSLPLRTRSVADFYHESIGALSELGIEPLARNGPPAAGSPAHSVE